MREQRSRCNCFMTDFHKLFTVKMNKMTDKKTVASFLVVYLILLLAFWLQIARKLCHVYSPDCRLHTIFATFRRSLKCLLVRIQGGLCLFHYVLDNMNWLVFIFLSNLIISLMYNIIKKVYFNDQHKFRV